MRTASNNDSRFALWRDLVHGAPQQLKILKPARAVCVDHKEPSPTGVKHAVSDGAAFADVLFEDDDADVALGVLRAELECKVGCAVARSVVNNENLV